jgi:hypothetical protein
MRRAVSFFLLAALILGSPLAARSATIVDGAGMIPFGGRPPFKVGDWVKYRTQGSSLHGHSNDYTVTILIAGEELFWGERCFWVETWTEAEDEGKQVTASLITYDIFGDSLATTNLSWFLRKTIHAVDDKGNPVQLVNSRPSTDFKSHPKKENELREAEKDQDTLGVETVTTPIGTYQATKVRRTSKIVELMDKGDSTIYYEKVETRDAFYSPEIPVTRLVREDIDDHQQGRSWMIGNRKDATRLNTLERAQGATTLVAFGSGNLEPAVVPVSLRRSIDEQERTQRAPARTPARRTGARGSGRSG